MAAPGGEPGAGAGAESRAAAALLLGRARRLDLAMGTVDGRTTGIHRSPFHGRGVEFADLREYQAGDDDVRAIDWKVTARFGSPYVREFAEDRDTQVHLVIDVSGSSSFGSGAAPKAAKAAEVAAAVLSAAVEANDSAGAFFVAESVRGRVPLGRGRRHALRILGAAIAFGGGAGRTDLAASLARIAAVLRRRAAVIIVSDFDDDTGFDRPLRLLCARHSVTAVRVHDRREADLPDVGLIELEDSETGEQLLVDTSDASFRRRYAAAAARRDEGLPGRIARAGAAYAQIEAGDTRHGTALRRQLGGAGRHARR